MSGKTIFFGLLLAAGLACAAAQACPSTVCKAKFDNAYPAPTDCCVHDYKANPKCKWGGTPVSWTQVRTCSAGGASYSVLTQGNFQGPPPSSAECRCANTVAAPSGGSQGATKPLQVSSSVTLKPQADKDMAGNDISCSGQSFCKVCGGLESVRAACAKQQPGCKALTFNPLEGCGYLKKASGALASRQGWVTYVQYTPK